MGSLEEQLLNVNVILISTAAWFILWALRRVWKGIDTNDWVSRYKPIYPALICQGFVWIPGALPVQDVPTVGYRILMGFWCGFLASIGYQLVKRVLLPRGIKLPEKADDLVPSSGSDGRSPDQGGEWKTPAISSEENLVITRKETPPLPPQPPQPPGVEFRPPKPEDLFKPPKD